MKVLAYCQHVLGIGHFIRTLEICRALERHDVILVTGGPPPPVNIPRHVRQVGLVPLFMDADFGRLYSPERHPVDTVMAERRDRLMALFRSEAPDLFLVELYPFGRKAFRFELDPVLEAIRSGRLPRAFVACSVRDILAEKQDVDRHESRALSILNSGFDAVLVHGDPEVARLEDSYSRCGDIAVPVIYTGYVASAEGRQRNPERRSSDEKAAGANRILVSAGGGKVGQPLFEAVIGALDRLQSRLPIACRIYTGPYMEPAAFRHLAASSIPGLEVHRFAEDLRQQMSCADLSISMAGYNTCMDILSSRVPALVWPFNQNREQPLRAKKLALRGCFRVLSHEDLKPARLAERIVDTLAAPPTGFPRIRIDGAHAVARWVDLGFPETLELP
jgi:predicted glycosyltransferase